MKFTKIEKVDNTYIFIVINIISTIFLHFTRSIVTYLSIMVTYFDTQTHTNEIDCIRIGKEDTKLLLFIKSGISTKKIQHKLQMNY